MEGVVDPMQRSGGSFARTGMPRPDKGRQCDRSGNCKYGRTQRRSRRDGTRRRKGNEQRRHAGEPRRPDVVVADHLREHRGIDGKNADALHIGGEDSHAGKREGEAATAKPRLWPGDDGHHSALLALGWTKRIENERGQPHDQHQVRKEREPDADQNEVGHGPILR